MNCYMEFLYYAFYGHNGFLETQPADMYGYHITVPSK
jgi:hypothetical protein